jgi:hypothetical protein
MWLVRGLVLLLLAVAAVYAGTTGTGQSDPPRAFQVTLPTSSQRWVSTVSKRTPSTQENDQPDVERRDWPIRIDDIIRALDTMHR